LGHFAGSCVRTPWAFRLKVRPPPRKIDNPASRRLLWGVAVLTGGGIFDGAGRDRTPEIDNPNGGVTALTFKRPGPGQ
jgi:hypothetical protein